MEAPTEIWQLIIREAIDILPLKSLCEARIVNGLLAMADVRDPPYVKHAHLRQSFSPKRSTLDYPPVVI